MNMVDGVLLVVDSVDGPKPQTRFVLKKVRVNCWVCVFLRLDIQTTEFITHCHVIFAN
jgi:predicted membrane GTPase involved in stress response